VETIGSSPVAFLLLAVGVTSLLSLLFLIVFFTGVPAFGPLNDTFIGVAAVLSAVVVVLGSLFMILRVTGFVLSGMYMSLGNAIPGLWLLGLGLISRAGDLVPPGLRITGIVAGALMVFGLMSIVAVARAVDEWSSIPSVFYVAGLGAVGWVAMYPVLCILVALRFLRT
jgi:hypothetical protein